MMGNKPIIRGHCCSAQWTKALSSTLSLFSTHSRTLHICSVPSVERDVQLRQP